jgi:hypothetical protein
MTVWDWEDKINLDMALRLIEHKRRLVKRKPKDNLGPDAPDPDGWPDPSVPDDEEADDKEQKTRLCPICSGKGRDQTGGKCKNCGGSGRVPEVEDDEDTHGTSYRHWLYDFGDE